MTVTDFLLSAFVGACSGAAVHYRQKCIELSGSVVDSRKALREREATEGEAVRQAFQDGLRVGIQMEMEGNESSVACDCSECRRDRMMRVN